jgi:hypothetical protein
MTEAIAANGSGSPIIRLLLPIAGGVQIGIGAEDRDLVGVAAGCALVACSLPVARTRETLVFGTAAVLCLAVLYKRMRERKKTVSRFMTDDECEPSNCWTTQTSTACAASQRGPPGTGGPTNTSAKPKQNTREPLQIVGGLIRDEGPATGTGCGANPMCDLVHGTNSAVNAGSIESW